MAAVRRKRFAVGSTEDYEQTCFLGQGGYGAVVMARHRANGQAVAIKRLAAGELGPWAVMREAGFLEDCGDNPYVVGFHGLVRQPGTTELRLVMECAGPSLRDLFLQRLADDTPLQEATVRLLMWQLLTGVKMMHERHIMHRDIKPENILVNADKGVAKICDFGLALRMSEAPPYGQAGTTWYMAPEVLLGKTDYDAAVDAWSLGCVMAELVGGSPLFQGENEEDQLCAIFDVLGVPDESTWPWFSSTPFGNGYLREVCLLYPYGENLLHECFPETMLSRQGFEVLSGLLTWNPDKRLTASAALKLPWFDCYRFASPAGKDALTSALPQTKDPQMTLLPICT